MEIVLTSQPEQRQRFLSALETFGRENRLPAPVMQAADLALEEHLTNIMRYAFEDSLPHPILIRLTVEAGYLRVEVEDAGKPFNPLASPEPDTSVPLELKPIGGLGIHLIRRFMDEVTYRREAEKNVLCLRKRVRPGTEAPERP